MYIGHLFLNERIILLIKHIVEKYIIRGFQRCITCNMAQHPWGRTVEILGIESPTNGRSCEEHVVCGSVLQDDVVVRLRKAQVVIDEKEEAAIAAFWVSDGVDRFRVGYLPKFHVKHWKLLEGALAQIIEVYHEDSDSPTKRQKHHRNSGCAVAALISPPITSAIPPSPTKSLSKKRKTQQEQDEEKGFNTEEEISVM